MNPSELAKNEQLARALCCTARLISHPAPRSLSSLPLLLPVLAQNSFFVRDLNADPGLQAPDGSFDAVICCVSIQYLQFPEKVLQEVYRVLKPGGVVIFSFSNRMFYNKAIAAWRDGTGYSRTQLVKQYFLVRPGRGWGCEGSAFGGAFVRPLPLGVRV